MDSLDSRATNSNSAHPRNERFFGTPSKNDVPAEAKQWMINTNDDSAILAPETPDHDNNNDSAILAPLSPELFF